MHGIYVFPLHGGIDTEVSQASSMATWHHFLCTRFGRQTTKQTWTWPSWGQLSVCMLCASGMTRWVTSFSDYSRPSGLSKGLDRWLLPPWKFASQTNLWTSGTSSSLLSFVTTTIPTAGIALSHLVQGFCLNRRHLWRKDGGVEKQKNSRTRTYLIPKNFWKKDQHILQGPDFTIEGGRILANRSGWGMDGRKTCRLSTSHQHDRPRMRATYTGDIHFRS